MKNIIDFIIDASKNAELTQKFQKQLNENSDFQALQTFFKNLKYNVSDDECIRILENSSKFPLEGNLKDY